MADHPTTATGTPTQGVPVVDLSATINGLLEHADEVRHHRLQLLDWAERYGASMARRADYLESIAGALASGLTDG